jgi:hypothetical protein
MVCWCFSFWRTILDPILSATEEDRAAITTEKAIQVLGRTLHALPISLSDLEAIMHALEDGIEDICRSGGYGKFDFVFEAKKLAYYNLHVAKSYKKK